MSNESQARQIVQKLKTLSVALKSMAAKPHDVKLRKEADHLKTQANLLIRQLDALYNADKELFQYLDAANAHHQHALLSEYNIRTKDSKMNIKQQMNYHAREYRRLKALATDSGKKPGKRMM